jgi:hypothetical protein
VIRFRVLTLSDPSHLLTCFHSAGFMLFELTFNSEFLCLNFLINASSKTVLKRQKNAYVFVHVVLYEFDNVIISGLKY